MARPVELQLISYRDWARPEERHTVDFRVVNNTLLPIPLLFYSVSKNGGTMASGMVVFPMLSRRSGVETVELQAGKSGSEDYEVKISPIPLTLAPIDKRSFTLAVVGGEE